MTFEEWWKRYGRGSHDHLFAAEIWEAAQAPLLKKIARLEKKTSDDSWITNPDRMGGGGWTEEEKNNPYGWK